MSNPFDILYGIVGGYEVLLRPVKFNDTEYDKNCRRSNGELLRPTAIVTTCPMCGSLIEQEISEDVNLSQSILINCEQCTPPIINKVKEIVFPFVDPIQSCALTLFDVNSMALNTTINMFNDNPAVVNILSVSNIENDLVERRSDGIGQYIRKRDLWKKTDNKVIKRFNGDVFDIMGELVDESNNQPDQSNNQPDQPENFDT